MLKLSPLGNRLQVDEVEIALTVTESLIIGALLKGKGNVVGTEALVEVADCFNKRAVHTHVWRLRQKGVPIVTESSWGYSLA